MQGTAQRGMEVSDLNRKVDPCPDFFDDSNGTLGEVSRKGTGQANLQRIITRCINLQRWPMTLSLVPAETATLFIICLLHEFESMRVAGFCAGHKKKVEQRHGRHV